MAGRRQHYIPRFLMKGFASTTKRQGRILFAHWRDKVEHVDVRAIGAENNFYGDGNQSPLDETITQAEHRFASIIRYCIEKSAIDTSVDEKELRRMLVHFELRSRAFLSHIQSLSNDLMKLILELCVDELTSMPELRKSLEADTELREKHGEQSRELIDEVCRRCGEELLGELKNEIKRDLPRTIHESYRSFLEGDLYPEKRLSCLDGMSFRVIETTGDALILGDSMVFYESVEANCFLPFSTGYDKVERIILPISPHQAIVGSRSSFACNSADLRKAAASCSRHMFLSRATINDNNELRCSIGTSVMDLEEKIMADAIAHLIMLLIKHEDRVFAQDALGRIVRHLRRTRREQ